MSNILNCYVPTGDYWPNVWPGTTTNIMWSDMNHYFYQITCPKCSQKNWCELDKTVNCDGILSQERRPNGKKTYCGAVLKAVSKVVDEPIQVEV